MDEFGFISSCKYIETLMNIIKVYMGNGLFGMGYAFKHVGLFMGAGLTIMFTLAALYSNHVLVSCSKEIISRARLNRTLNMPEVVDLCLGEGPACCSASANCVKRLISFSIIILQLAICCVYIVFSGISVKSIVEGLVDDFEMDKRIYMAIVTVPMLGTSLIRELKYLAPVSFIANIVLCFGTAVVLFIVSQDLPHVSTRPYIVSIYTYPIFFGMILFSLSGIGMTMPLRNEMQNPDHFDCWYGVLNVAFVVCGLLLCSVGFVAYLKYGDLIHGSVTLNLPENSWYSIAVQIAITLSIMCSYALNFYLAHVMVWIEIETCLASTVESDILDTLMTIFLVGITLVMSVLLPKLGGIISLTGALTNSMLIFFFPNLCDLALRWPTNYGFLFWRFFAAIFLLITGMVTMITGVYVSTYSLIKYD